MDITKKLNITDTYGRVTGTKFNANWIKNIHVNTSAVERRVATLTKRRTVKKQWQAAWLLRAISCIDLTTLSGDDTPGRVQRLCAKARQPVRKDILLALGAEKLDLTAGAVCVYHGMIKAAVQSLKGTNIPIAAVSTGFPAGLTPLETRLSEIKASVAAGATEIDIVISRQHVLNGHWRALYDEVKFFREACGEAHMKSIIATGELGSANNIAKTSMVCMMAGADFIKTSTGMESTNACLFVSLIMIRMLREFFDYSGQRVGFKPAGGIANAKDALNYLFLIKEELGNEWLNSHYFRFGASRLLGDIERQLEYFVTGQYSAANRHPLT